VAEVPWGDGKRTLGRIDAIGIDEIQCAKGHKYLTLLDPGVPPGLGLCGGMIP
jgi:hypothetical protein